MTETWWTEWHYEPDELVNLADPRQREAGYCRIGPRGISWPGSPPLYTKFGQLTAVEIKPGTSPNLYFEWHNPRYGGGVPVAAPLELILVNLALSLVVRTLEEPEWMEVTLPIPRRHEGECAALVDRFSAFVKPRPESTARTALSTSEPQHRAVSYSGIIVLLCVVLIVVALVIVTVVSIQAIPR